MATTDGRTAARGMRTDARRNRDHLVAVAEKTLAELGPEASLNQIARRAGVGPGTLYRHFPTRDALLAAVLEDRIATLCARADDLRASAPPDTALAAWLRAFLDHARLNQGMAGALMAAHAAVSGTDCHQVIRDAAAELLTRAQSAGTARADLTAPDLIQLVVGIALATAHGDDADQPERLLAFVQDAIFTGRSRRRG
jgi:AcrR family transcriptional regulator